MDVDRDADFRLQRFHQFVGAVRTEKSGHIFDADGIGAHLDQFFTQFDEVFILMVRTDGVDDTSLGMTAGLFGGPDGGFQVPRIVQGIENADNGDPVIHRPLDEFCHHVVGHVGVSQKVLAPEKHLDRGMGQVFLQQSEPLPGVLIQVAEAHVEGGTTPGFDGVIAGAVHFFQDRQHIYDAHAGGGDGLVAVAENGFYDFYRFLCHFIFLDFN